ARRLTFGVSAAVEPTVLNDGRILFVSAKPATGTNAEPSLGLYTVNNDGTEVAAYALNRDGAPWVNRPRELQNGWVGFIAAGGPGASFAEGVRTARPFNSRKRLFGFDVARCRSVESGLNGAVLACLQTPEPEAAAKDCSLAVFEIKAGDNILTPPLFDDPAWHDIEAMRPGTRPAPLGHISAMSPAKGFGTILCLNANYSRERQDDGKPLRTASRVRVTSPDADGGTKSLGDVPLRPDGSFMAEVPADRPLGFESLDESGTVIHRLPPYLWVRAGENRTCIGCHEPSNRSPRNLRPLAVNQPVVKFSLTADPVAQAAH
ncbi:MAG: hypothetical protein MUF25_22235, partial [Pirellulaceae bacterium]|nr:hypothetical protein [Pirellulaceae bacterium]